MKHIENIGKKMERPVHFDATELCAMDFAFENPLNVRVIQRLRKRFPGIYTTRGTELFKGASKMSMSYEEFNNFLVASLDILELENNNLQANHLPAMACGHSPKDHRQALESVINKISDRFQEDAN